MSVVRAFIAIELPSSIQKNLKELVRELKGKMAELPVRWLPIENIHLTLKFLRELPITTIEKISNILKSEAAERSPFLLRLGGMGVFPHPRRPRIIWVGVEAANELMDLQRCLEDEMGPFGIPAERRSFSPHLTIGRVNKRASGGELKAIGLAVEAEDVASLGDAKVDGISLFQSDLTPNGAVYTKLFAATFGDQV